jgi:hypothetical protein
MAQSAFSTHHEFVSLSERASLAARRFGDAAAVLVLLDEI